MASSNAHSKRSARERRQRRMTAVVGAFVALTLIGTLAVPFI